MRMPPSLAEQLAGAALGLSGSGDAEIAAASPAPVTEPLARFEPFDVDVPSMAEHVAREAESRLPGSLRTPLLLLRTSMLLQDAIEAACMCARAHIDAPLLAKHLLGSEQYQQFLSEANAATGDSAGSASIEAYAAAVRETVGEVRPCCLRCPCPPRPLQLSPTARSKLLDRRRCILPAARALRCAALQIIPRRNSSPTRAMRDFARAHPCLAGACSELGCSVAPPLLCDARGREEASATHHYP